jgi:outer membrane lipoprotein-sorting protein
MTMPSAIASIPLSGIVLMLAGIGLPHQQSKPVSTAPVPALTAEDVLKRTRALYPTLESYADSGIVTQETSGYIDRSSFRTYYAGTQRNFLFDYRQMPTVYKSGVLVPMSGHMVLWMLHGQLQSWDSVSGSHQEFPEGGNQVSAFVQATAATSGVAVLVPSLIYVQANLVTTIQELGDVTSAGLENLRGRRCYKLMGIARSVYPSGQVTNVRPVTVWIDAETFLIRQVFTDTPKGYPSGQIYRLTVAYEPRLNPSLPDSLFTFAVPSAQQ